MSQARPRGECLAQTPGQRSLVWCAPLVNGPLCCPQGTRLALPPEEQRPREAPPSDSLLCPSPAWGGGRGERDLHSANPVVLLQQTGS